MLFLPTLAAAALLAAGAASDAPARFDITASTLIPAPIESADARFAVHASARLQPADAPPSDRFALKTIAGSLACTGSVGSIFSNGFE